MVLVTLGGFHLLDGLVSCGSIEARKEIMRCSEEVLMRGIMLAPQGSRRATLVELVIELPSLLGLVLAMPNVWAWRVMPISHQTTK